MPSAIEQIVTRKSGKVHCSCRFFYVYALDLQSFFLVSTLDSSNCRVKEGRENSRGMSVYSAQHFAPLAFGFLSVNKTL